MSKSPRTIYLLRIIESAIRSGMEQRLREFQLTDVQYTVLSILDAHDGFTSAELSRSFRVTPQSMSEMITTLERKEMISRHEDPTNRRILRLRLTPYGRSVFEKCDDRIDELEAELFGRLSREDVSRFRRLLSLVVADRKGTRSPEPRAAESLR
jgi:DNA-binding MarR family transcriptional regulator